MVRHDDRKRANLCNPDPVQVSGTFQSTHAYSTAIGRSHLTRFARQVVGGDVVHGAGDFHQEENHEQAYTA
jgi:hypothetical protein